MPNMSFMITPDQFLDGTKTVTRRDGWWNIKIGEVHQGVRKSQGLKKGEKVERLGDFIPIGARAEPLCRLLDEPEYGKQEVILEGFPRMTPLEFVTMFLNTHKKATMSKPVNRIEFVRSF